MSICAHLTSQAYLSMYLSRKRSAYVLKPCTKTFFHTSHAQAVFIELMESATSSLEFSFNDTKYKQTEGVAMDSPLGPALANIFVGYHESKLFFCVQKPTIYFLMLMTPLPSLNKRVTLTISWSRLIVYILLSSSRFEKEHDGKLPFLDILVEKLNLVSRPVYTESSLFLVNTSAGNPSAHANGKRT